MTYLFIRTPWDDLYGGDRRPGRWRDEATMLDGYQSLIEYRARAALREIHEMAADAVHRITGEPI